MAYYQGDYYQGDYYQGGLFSSIGHIASSLWNKIVRPAAVSTLESAVPGGAQIGAVIGSAASAARKTATTAAAATGRIILQHPVLSAAGGAALAAGAGAALMHHRDVKAAMAGRKRRRMNVCNPKALRRSIRRTHGFAKLAMKTIRITHPGKKGRFGGFKKRKRA